MGVLDVEAETHPETGERFEGLVPPVVRQSLSSPLDDYAASGVIRAETAEVLRGAVASRQNVLVAAAHRRARRRW